MKKHLTITFSLVLLAVLAFASVLTAQMLSRPQTNLNYLARGQTPPATYSFQQGVGGYSGTADSTLRSDRVRKNFGTNTVLKIQADNWILGVIRFDLASIPPNSTVQNARLELYLNSKNDTKSFNMGLYRLLRPWVENQVTWGLAMTGVKWGAEGASQVGVDREGTASATAFINATNQWYFFDVTQAVQGWINNPSSNYGFVARGDGSNNVEFNFASSNFTTLSLRPRLVVTLTSGEITTPTPTFALTPTPTLSPGSTPTPTPSPAGGVWKPALNTSWQWQLNGTLDTSLNVAMYDIDLFDNSSSEIVSLKNSGKKVICYYSAGSWENWRPDAGQFPDSVKGNNNGWPGEKWLDIRRLDVLGPIMSARIDLAKQKGCDGVEPDNVDGYSNNTGFPLTYNDQLTYNRWTADAAHARGLSVGLKNDIEQINDLLSSYDWTLNEQCFQYNECDPLTKFIQAGKAVFHVEYKLDTSQFCPQANSANFNSIKKNLDLDAYRVACR